MSVFKTFSNSIGTLLITGAIITVPAAPKFTFNDGKSDLEITQSYQIWGVYTRAIDNVPVTDSRADLYLRQGRLGFKGKVLPSLSYSALFAYDNIGKDQFTGTISSPQASPNTTFQMLDLYMQYALDVSSTFITFGYMRPQTGHENIAPDAEIISIDKALTSTYLRSFETGRSNGRETGLNIGGFHTWDWFSALYNVGVFDMNQVQITGTDLGSRTWNPLLTTRAALSFGEPDMKSYKLSPEINAFGNSKGITIGGHYAYEGKTDETWDTSAIKYDATKKVYSGALKYVGGFGKTNVTYGGDFVANFFGLNIDGEFDFLKRELVGISYHHDSVSTPSVTFTDQVFHIRAGYIFALPNKQFVEPAFMYSQFAGDDLSVLFPSGEDKVIDAGVNWYINKNNLKLSLHYVNQSGKPKSLYQTAAPTKTGAVTKRGDMVIVGFQVQI